MFDLIFRTVKHLVGNDNSMSKEYLPEEIWREVTNPRSCLVVEPILATISFLKKKKKKWWAFLVILVETY